MVKKEGERSVKGKKRESSIRWRLMDSSLIYKLMFKIFLNNSCVTHWLLCLFFMILLIRLSFVFQTWRTINIFGFSCFLLLFPFNFFLINFFVCWCFSLFRFVFWLKWCRIWMFDIFILLIIMFYFIWIFLLFQINFNKYFFQLFLERISIPKIISI